jgi:hypothetical protein
MKAGDKQINRVAGISECTEIRREWKNGHHFSLARSWDGMKLFLSLTTTDRISRRQEQEFRMALKKEVVCTLAYRSRSRSHITTDSQSAISSWCLVPFGAIDQMVHLFE